VKGIAIYLEGGGDTAEGKARLRKGMNVFLAADLEALDKSRVADALAKATRNTTKGEYHKIRHASDLLARIDAEKVRSRCKHCERLFIILQALIAMQVIGGS
jgi:hypothetical protein